MFGHTQEELQKLGAIYTATEIYQQPDTWLKTLKIIEGNAKAIKHFLAKHITPDTRVVLTGAGTSEHTGNIARYMLSKLLPCRTESIPSTDLVANPASWVEPETPTVLVSFARSGNSPESVGAFNIMQNTTRKIVHLVITCAPDGQLALRAQQSSENFVLLLPEETNDKGFAMTSSFTCMLLAGMLFFDIDNLESNKAIVTALAEQGRRILDNDWQFVKSLSDTMPERVVYLGTACLNELGKELALKNMELTNGRIVTVKESVLGFRHGPKTIVNDRTLIMLLCSEDSHTRRYVNDLAAELSNDPGEHIVAAITYLDNEALAKNSDRYICINGTPMPEHFASLNYALYGQLLGLFDSIAIGNCPDSPNPSGVVNRVVKGVTIYPYPPEKEDAL